MELGFNIFSGLSRSQLYVIIGIVIIVGVAALILFIRSKRSEKDPNEPTSTVDEFDKSGYVHINEVERELEGASFLSFERNNGQIDHKAIGQPFIFTMAEGEVERHHLNARGSFRCLDPKTLFKGYVASIKELNRLAQMTEQLIQILRTGAAENRKASRHLRMFILLFFLAGMIGLGIAAATVRR